MTVTKALRGWLQENMEVADDADDSTCLSVAVKALMDGKITKEKLTELTEDPDAAKLKTIEDNLVSKVTEAFETKFASMFEKLAPQEAAETPEQAGDYSSVNTKNGVSLDTKAVGDAVGKAVGSTVNVKGAWEKYDDKVEKGYWPKNLRLTDIPHPMAGMPIIEGDGQICPQRQLEIPSNREKAAGGAFVKFQLRATTSGQLPQQLRPNEQDKELLKWGMKNMKWNGQIGGMDGTQVNSRYLNEVEQKMLADDLESGGTFVVPCVFDSNVIVKPNLTNQILPCVQVIPLSRGKLVESGIFNTVTWRDRNACEECTPFDCADLIGQFQVPIRDMCASLEFCISFLEDSPVDVFDIVSGQFQEAYLEKLDRDIVLGNGTSQICGIANTPGTTPINSQNGAAGPMTLADFVALCLNTPKRFQRNNSCSLFVGSQRNYIRARSMKVGDCDANCDERLLLGTDNLMNWEVLGKQWACIDEIPDTKVYHVDFSYYRLYVRQNIIGRTTREGATLCRSNKMLVCWMSRVGGKTECPQAINSICDFSQ